MRIRGRVAAVAIVLLSACASSPAGSGGASSTETTRITTGQGSRSITRVASAAPGVITLPATFDQVWRLLPTVYDSLGIAVSVSDPAQALFGNTGLRVRRKLGAVSLARYIDCGRTQGAPSAETYDVHLVVLTRVQPAPGGGTTASTTLEGSARPVSFASEYVTCSSTSFLERQVGDLLNDLLQR